MSQYRTTVFQYFQTGDIPTEGQFQYSWNSVWFKDEKFSISDTSGLEIALQNKLETTHATDANAHNLVLAKIDASNLSDEDKAMWRLVLGIGEIPENVALVDVGESNEVFNKTQIYEKVMMLADFVNSGKIRADKIEALGITTVIKSIENSLAAFVGNSANYIFEDNDFIAIPDVAGKYSLFMYIGVDKDDLENYLPTGLTNITIAMVEGLQAALNGKIDKPNVDGSFFTKRVSGVTSQQQINIGVNYLLFWNGTDFKESSIFRDPSGNYFGIGMVTPTEQLHLTGRVRTQAVVLDENSETLPRQITYENRKFYGSDSTGTKKQFLYKDFTDYLSFITSLTTNQKDTIGTAWSGQYSNSALQTYSISPSAFKHEHSIKRLVVTGLNLNTDPDFTQVTLIPASNILGTGEISVQGIQPIDVGTFIVDIYGDSVDVDVHYNIVFRTTSPTIQVYRTPQIIKAKTDIETISLSSITWEVELYNPATTGIISAVGGALSYNSDPSNKAYADEGVIVASAKSSEIILANQDYEIKGSGTHNHNDGSGQGILSSHYFGVVDSSDVISLLLNFVSKIRYENNTYSNRVYPDSGTPTPNVGGSTYSFDFSIVKEFGVYNISVTANSQTRFLTKPANDVPLSLGYQAKNCARANQFSINLSSISIIS